MLESLKVLIFCLKDKFGLLLGILKPNPPPLLSQPLPTKWLCIPTQNSI